MADLFACERDGCGHPLNLHDPCTATVGKGKNAHLCTCTAFQPADRKARLALITDTVDPEPPNIGKIVSALTQERPQ